MSGSHALRGNPLSPTLCVGSGRAERRRRRAATEDRGKVISSPQLVGRQGIVSKRGLAPSQTTRVASETCHGEVPVPVLRQCPARQDRQAASRTDASRCTHGTAGQNDPRKADEMSRRWGLSSFRSTKMGLSPWVHGGTRESQAAPTIFCPRLFHSDRRCPGHRKPLCGNRFARRRRRGETTPKSGRNCVSQEIPPDSPPAVGRDLVHGGVLANKIRFFHVGPLTRGEELPFVPQRVAFREAKMAFGLCCFRGAKGNIRLPASNTRCLRATICTHVIIAQPFSFLHPRRHDWVATHALPRR